MSLPELLIGYLVILAEVCGALVILLGVLRAIIDFFRLYFASSSEQVGQVGALRARLGHSMVIALEFLVAGDIVKTSLSPTWDEILFLAALIALRTVLNLLLERELAALSPERRS